MKKLNTLYFPDTAVFSETQFPVFLLIDKLNYLSPIESADEVTQKDIFAEHGFCQVHTPLPLGEDKERFTYLIKDIQLRKDDYAMQLNSLTIAAMSENKKSTKETRSLIMSSLVGQEAISEDDEKKQADIWQARLVLCLGEICDREEEELASHLNFFDDQEYEMFMKLQGELKEENDENPLEELMQIQQRLISPTPGAVEKRCKAWFKLLNNTKIIDPAVWFVSKSEAEDFLFEEYEKVTGNYPVLFDKISLPASIGKEVEYAAESIANFQKNNVTAREQIITAICNHVFQHGADGERAVIPSEVESQWEQILEESYPEDRHGRKKLNFYLLKDYCLTDQQQTPGTNSLVLVIK